jgi:predicted nucleic acid-binding protein
MLLERRPHSDVATALWAAGERKAIEVVVPAHGVTTIFYVVSRTRSPSQARRVLNDLLIVPSIAAVDITILQRALAFGWSDFEDAVCAAAAEATSCDLLVTRDAGGFKGSPVTVVDPVTALSLIGGGKGSDRVGERPAAAYRSKSSGRAKHRG